jgi:hypothetical protein
MKSLRPVYTIGPGHGMKTVSKKRVGTVAQCLVRWVTQVLHLDSYARSYGEPREPATMVMRRAGAGSSGHWKVKTDLEALACGVVALLQQPWAAVMPSIIRLSDAAERDEDLAPLQITDSRANARRLCNGN